jgi:hypothetical protein
MVRGQECEALGGWRTFVIVERADEDRGVVRPGDAQPTVGVPTPDDQGVGLHYRAGHAAHDRLGCRSGAHLAPYLH